MQIANIEALKTWLAATMGPICDADPATLAKYVLALIKKDRPEPELRLVCLNELEAFLLSKTAGFVELLFATLKDGSYEGFEPKTLPQPVRELSVAVPPPVVQPIGKSEVENSRSSDVKPTARTNISAAGSGSRNERRDSSRTVDRRSKSRDRNLTSQSGSGSRSHRTLSRNEEDHRSRNSKTYNRRSRNRSRTRSRDRSRERRVPISRRLGYRSDLRQRVDSIQSRTDRHSRGDRTYRRRSRSRRARSRSRSRSKIRSPPRVYSHMRAFSRSRSRSKTRSRSRSLSPLPNPSSPNAEWSSKRVSRSRSSEGRDENAYRITMPLDVILSNPPAVIKETTHVRKTTPQELAKFPPSKARCRDYDEQGLCLLGNLCPFDHGIDPVIVEDVNLPVPANLITFPGGQPPPVRPLAPVPHSLTPLPPVILSGPPVPLVAPPGVPLISSGSSVMRPLQSAPAPAVLPNSVVIDPTFSSTVRSSSSTEVMSLQSTANRSERNVVPVLPRNFLDGKRVVIPAQREVNLTHVGANQRDFTAVQDARYIIAQTGRSLDHNTQQLFGRKNVFDPSRLGTRQAPTLASKDDTTLELAGIPTQLNTISAINQELSKYGTIVNIQVYYDGLADRALVSFAQNAEAAAAFHSSEPVFNNRFVTVSWHSAAEQVTVPEVRKLSVKERLGTRPPEAASDSTGVQRSFAKSPNVPDDDGTQEPSEEKMIIVSPSGALTKTVFNKQLSNNSTVKHSANRVVNNSGTSASQQSNHKDLNKEQMKVRLEINKHKQLIMQKHVEKQKALIMKLENHDLSPEEKKYTIEMIKNLESQVQKMSSELNNSTKVMHPLAQKLPLRTVKPLTNHIPQERFQSPAEIRKSILDAELDLIAKENQGVDTADLRKKLALLNSQAAAQGLSGSRRGMSRPFRGRGVRGGSFAGRGRGLRGPLTSTTKLIDRRPKQLLLSGFASTAVDQVLASAAKFSRLESSKYLPDSNCILLTFVSRHDAEKAAVEGLSFQDKNILMSWFDNRKPKKNDFEEKKEEETLLDITEDEEPEMAEEDADASGSEKKFLLDDCESEVELIVEDDDYRDEELSNPMAVGFDEDVLDESELLKLDEDDDNGQGILQET